jgi:uncharacterized protein YcfJ
MLDSHGRCGIRIADHVTARLPVWLARDDAAIATSAAAHQRLGSLGAGFAGGFGAGLAAGFAGGFGGGFVGMTVSNGFRQCTIQPGAAQSRRISNNVKLRSLITFPICFKMKPHRP